MAYFLPSYFQKRLLRYALTRLDFIETDALNLEDLDITLGQRSVVELKNVGIRANKLVERLKIPSTVNVNHASIRILRITIPADLHISGIVVELDGIDIRVELQEYEKTHGPGSKTAPTHRDTVNRPRRPSIPIHDPGGHGAYDYVMPTSQDLAVSFLESEPVQDREELEAAIQSQSQRFPLSESTTSLAESSAESGIGMPGGFSLPGFVAKFFAGVADRLSISIKDVSASVAMKMLAEGTPAETVKLMIKLESISLDGIQSIDEIRLQQSPRSIKVYGFEVYLLSEAESFLRPSAASSPRLAKSRSKMSSTSREVRPGEFDSPEQRPLDRLNVSNELRSNSDVGRLNSPSSDDSSSSQLADLSVDLNASILEDSQVFSQGGVADPTQLQRQPEFTHLFTQVDNRQRAENLMVSKSGKHSFSATDNMPHDDLSESKVFTHGEAESMYMSAVSQAVAIPGAWEDPGLDSAEDSSIPAVPSERSVHSTASSPRLSRYSESMNSLRLHESPGNPTEILMSNLVAKQVIRIDNLKLSIPSGLSKTGRGEPETQSPDLHDNEKRSPPSTSTKRLGRATIPAREVLIDQSTMHLSRSTHFRSASREFMVATEYEYFITLGKTSINLDMAVGRLLIATTSQLNRYMPPALLDYHDKRVQEADVSELSVAVALEQLSLSICESIPEITAYELQHKCMQAPESGTTADTCLLQLQLTTLTYEIAKMVGEKRQRLSINQIVLGHSTQRYLYFVDTFGLRDSVTTSTMLKPHDLVVTNSNDRFDVQLKPFHAVVDLLKVDDVLSRSGGLSSILDLGNSMMSTGTVTDIPSKAHPTSAQRRSVRFDSSTSESTAPPGLKIDLRISGAVVDLIGSESSVQVRSSAIKLVSRAGSLRAQIDTVVLAGPVIGRSQTNPGVNTRIANLSLHYKDMPDEQDLDRLLSLLTPSQDKYDDEDDIMVDTLVRQRRKGAVLRVNISEIKTDVSGFSWLNHVTRLGDELAKLATVTKYLPEDDRPGILTFYLANKITINTDFGRAFGILHLQTDLLEGAIISVPSLMAAQVNSLSVKRGTELLLGEVVGNLQDRAVMGPPMLMCRFIADEMEPTVRIKLFNACLEYTVSTLLALNSLAEILKSETLAPETASPDRASEVSSASDKSEFSRRVKISTAIRDSAIALNPVSGSARGLVLLSDVLFTHQSKRKVILLHLEMKKASILIIDDVAKLGQDAPNADHKLYFEENDQVQELTKAGYVPVASISNAAAVVNLTEDEVTQTPLVDVEFRNNLFLMETCADSTQTLIQILSGLSPPSPPSQVAKYRTQVIPIEDMLDSFTGNAFVSEPGPELGLQASQVSNSTRESDVDSEYDNEEDDDDDTDGEDEGEEEDSDDESDFGADNTYREDNSDHDRMTESYLESDLSESRLSEPRMTGPLHVAPVNLTASSTSSMEQSIMAHSMLDFRTDHFVHKSSVGGTAHRWDSVQNTYGLGTENRASESPLKVRIRDVHFIWNLFDGYDWQTTRDTISQAVKDIETKAMARQPRRRDSRHTSSTEENESVIGDFLFNSIYIGIPANKDPRDLAAAINEDIGDMASETGSYATGTTVTASPSGRGLGSRSKAKKLRLNRSRQHKMTFELSGVSADFIAFPSGSGEVESSIDVRVRTLEIFDHVPTSTWKKFATYMHEAGEREVGTNMVHLELLKVKPIAELSASEIVLKLTVLPLRLHVDQDALDFLTRFFEFKDERAPVSGTPSNPPFIQRAEVNPIRLRLDFKPKRVDYGGLRSGRTTEFMNFFVLDRADMVLRRIILYGVSGFDRLGVTLNNIWTPDVKKNQLPTVLAGLAPIRSLVDVGSGVKDLVAVPIREYKKDGRIVRSIQKGAIAFAKTTTTELVNLGAKLAIGTQTVLQSAEEMLVSKPSNEESEEQKEQISLYADQPVGIVQGLRGAYASLERDLLLAKDAIVAVPGEVMASGSAAGAAKAIIKQSPIIILRPAIGASKAVGQTLLGAGNTLDKGNLRRVENKYKHH